MPFADDMKKIAAASFIPLVAIALILGIYLNATLGHGTSTSSTSATGVSVTETVSISPQASPPFLPYTIAIWTNGTNPSTISDIFVNVSQVPTIVKFFVNSPSFVFASPSSFQINPSSNGTLFDFAYTNGTSIPYNLDKNRNDISTQFLVSGWIEIESWPA